MQRLILVLCVFASVLAGMSLPAHARIWHASLSGSGEACSATDACSAATAISRARSGDVVQFGAGKYRIQLNTQANGVTFKGAPDFATTIVRPSGATGEQGVTIRHDDTIIERFVIDGEKKAGYKHGLIRFYSSKNVTIQQNRIINSKGTLISIGGSVPKSRFINIKIIGNYISGAGFAKEWGEAVYVGANDADVGAVSNIEITGNIIRDFADNGIDLKQSTKNVEVKYNLIEKQVLRTETSKYGSTVVTQGMDHRIHDNIIRDVDSARGVFNLTTRSNTKVYDNAITNAKGEWMVRQRGNGNSTTDIVTANLFCKTSTRKAEAGSGLIIKGNPGLDEPEQDCAPRIKVLLAELNKYQAGDPVKPPPDDTLPVIHVAGLTWGETGSNVIRVYIEAEGGADPQMSKRTLNADMVKFETMDGTPLVIDRDKSAKPEYPPGWSFYLAPPYPADEPIRMIAQEGWITGAPAINREIPVHGSVKPEPTQLKPGETARCANPVLISEQADGSGFMIKCGE